VCAVEPVGCLTHGQESPFSRRLGVVGAAGLANTFYPAIVRIVGPVRSGYDVLRVLLAAVLLTAAALKAYQLATEPVAGHGLLDSRWLLMATVEFELLFGIWLLSGSLPKPTWAAALICFSLFACVSLYKGMAGEASCGCWGRVAVSPWWTGIFDLAIVMALLRWQPSAASPLPPGEGKGEGALSAISVVRRAVGVLAIWLLIGVPAAVAMGSYTSITLSDAGDIIGDDKIVVLEPEEWVGKRFPLLDYIDIGDKLKDGEWFVILYHYDCPKCQEAIKKLVHEMLVKGKRTHVALIEVPPYGETQSYISLTEVGFWLGRLSSEREWFVITPTQLQLERGIIVESTIGPIM
jgi:hypothetical protein